MNSFGQDTIEKAQAYLASRTPVELAELVISFTTRMTQLSNAAQACRRAGYFELARDHDGERASIELDRGAVVAEITKRCER